MNASFLKRSMSSVIDIIMVFVIIYFTFILIGRPLLQKQIVNFDEMYSSYTQLVSTYNEDMSKVQTEYSANMEIANGDADQEAAAQALYQAKVNMLNDQNDVDLEPYNLPLSYYFLMVIYYFAIGFIVFMTIYTLIVSGKTIGRKIMKVKLEGNVNRMAVFFHDIMLKYFFVILVFAVSPYYGFMFLSVSLIADMILINFTRNKSTIRDLLLKIKVVKAGYGY